MPGDAHTNEDGETPAGTAPDTEPEDPTRVKSALPPQTTAVATRVSTPEPEGPDSGMEDDFARRYVVHSLLGQGGMGEVHLCEDQRIGRRSP